MAAHRHTNFLLNKFKYSVCFVQRRNRVKTKWASTRAKIPATNLALQHFDMAYGTQLGDVWPSVRIALLSEQKYGALLNSFTSTEEASSRLHSHGCTDFIQRPAGPERGAAAGPRIRSNIQCFVFPRGDVSRFRPARPGTDGLLGHYLMDAASVLPVLALDVQPGHTVLDLCAGPGGKTLAILQTQAVHMSGFLWANDLSGSRTARLQRTLQSYVPKGLRREDRIRITSLDGRRWRTMEDHAFDRVLVDVPCTTDRHSLLEEDNNIFKRSRTKERQKLPSLQLELLLAGIRATRPGGHLVYSTCSLSPLQNECVVEQAVSQAEQEMGIAVQPQDLGGFARLFSDTFGFASRSSVGELVLPHLCANFGPIYLCKLQRLG